MMKSSPRILMFFCTAFTWSPDTCAADDVWGLDRAAQQRYSSHNNLFNFDDYEATMASLDTADRQAEREVNTLYKFIDIYDDQIRQDLALSQVPQPILENVVLLDHPDYEDDSIMQKILAESLRTAKLEQAERVDTVKEEVNKRHNQVGALTETIEKLTINVEKLTEEVNNFTENVKERQADEQKAWVAYNALKDPDPQIETLEDHEERERRHKIREEEKQEAAGNWCSLFNVYNLAETKLKEKKEVLNKQKEELKKQEEDLKKLEEELDAMVQQHQASSENLESLKKETNELGALLEIMDK